MADRVVDRAQASTVAAAAPEPATPAVGRDTLLRGLSADVEPTPAAAPPAAAPARGAPPAPRPGALELMFGAPAGRGLHAGELREGQAVRGGDGGTPSPEPPSATPTAGPAPTPPTGGGTPTPTPAAVTIASTTTAGPTFGPGGAAMWHVAFSTTGRTGWIVQKIHNTVAGTTAAGGAITPASIGLAADYYEAWSVDGAGAVTPAISGANDYWDQGAMPARSRGSWSTTGDLHWVAGAARPSGMSPSAVPNAGILVSSYSAPSGLGPVLLHRSARATWDSTTTPPTDSGTAS